MSFSFSKTRIPQSYAARTDVGSVREHNEDSYLAKSPLFVVADGMGGHEAGEVASRLAVETMAARLPKSPNPERLAAAVVSANEAVLRGAKDGTGKPGMGTTMTAATIFNDEVTIAQVGDSRAYLLHNDEIQRITRDHSLMEDLIEQGRLTEAEARFHPQRSVITRALGSDPNMQPDTYMLQVENGDRLLLCSDGLSSMISDKTIEKILNANPSPAEACDALVDEALAAGGLDNVTVIVIDPLGDFEGASDSDVKDRPASLPTSAPTTGRPTYTASPSAQDQSSSLEAANRDLKASNAKAKPRHTRKPRQKGRLAPLLWAIAFIAILVAAGIGFYAYAQNSYYLITDNGVVSVYRGLPGQIGAFKVSWLEEQAPDIDVTMLNPTTQNRLANGISVNSMEEAEGLLKEYRQTVAEVQRAQNPALTTPTTGSASSSTSASSKATNQG